jgi:predicted AAA+ superfamily ATPase
MKRYLTKYIEEDLATKIILLTGPRQTGKTTLSNWINYWKLADFPNHFLTERIDSIIAGKNHTLILF